MRGARSRARAYLAGDDHGPLALQEILLASCPTVGVCTGASLVRDGVTGVLVDRLPPGAKCVANDRDEVALHHYIATLRRAVGMDRHGVRDAVCDEFATERIVDRVVAALETARGI